MTALEADALRRENAYLKTRCLQLEGDVGDLTAELTRLREAHDRLTARRAASRPDPLSGGQ